MEEEEIKDYFRTWVEGQERYIWTERVQFKGGSGFGENIIIPIKIGYGTKYVVEGEILWGRGLCLVIFFVVLSILPGIRDAINSYWLYEL